MKFIRNPIGSHRAASLILILYLCLGVLYSLATPILEASDEFRHFPYVAHLAATGRLPVQQPERETLWAQEGSQPPLYYALSAALISAIDTSDLDQIFRLNPHARIGVPLARHNKNMIIHTDAELFPWRGTALAVHLVRFFSLLLSAGTILCTYALGRLLFPRRRWVASGAMAVNAFIPMFLFISASVNNDNLVIFLAALTLLLLARALLAPSSPLVLAGIGVVIGLACLTKLSALGLLPLAGLTLLMRHFLPSFQIGDRPLRKRIGPLIRDALALFVPVLLVAGWWYLRNWQLYGDPLGLNAMLAIVGQRPAPPSPAQLWSEFQGFRINFWGLFGGVNILMRPRWIYALLDGVALLAAIGLLPWFARQWRYNRRRFWLMILLILWLAIEFAALIRWTSVTYASQGRLIFPALPVIAIALVVGSSSWVPARGQQWIASGLAAGLALLAATVPFTTLRPAYTQPPLLTTADLPATLQPYNVTYGGVMQLLGYSVDRRSVSPGDWLSVTLYWQVLAPTAEDYSLFLQLSDQAGERFLQIDSFPGGGAYATSDLPVGAVVGFTYTEQVIRAPEAPTAAYLEVGLYDHETGERLRAVDPNGDEVDSPVLTRIKVDAPTPAPTPEHPVAVNFDDRVQLVGFDFDENALAAGEQAPLTLHWQATSTLDRNYTVFVHLLDEAGQIVAQADAPPRHNAYPTSFWEAGEFIADQHRFDPLPDLSPGQYRIVVGFYDPATGARLPVIGEDGEVADDHAVTATFAVDGE